MATFSEVRTETPPLMDQETGLTGVDVQGCFADVPENYVFNAQGKLVPKELPVFGAVGTIPVILQQIALANRVRAQLTLTQDVHLLGNSTILSSFYFTEMTFVTPEMVAGWSEKNHPIRSTRFTFAEYRQVIEMTGGLQVWNDHAVFNTPLFELYQSVYKAALQNPNFVHFRKGERRSQIIPGFVPESYSAELMVTGESLGLAAMLKGSGLKRVKVIGWAGDVCAGKTALHLAKAGLEVWFCINGQASVRVPLGNGVTTEDLMVDELSAEHNIHFYRHEDDMAVNGQLLAS